MRAKAVAPHPERTVVREGVRTARPNLKKSKFFEQVPFYTFFNFFSILLDPSLEPIGWAFARGIGI